MEGVGIVISVIVPVFNGANHLRQTIDSLANQTFKDFECLLIDDCSSDDSPAIMASTAAADSRFRLVQQESNKGVAAARNRGLAEASGDYIAFLDQDDLLHSHALEYMLNAAKQSECEVVAAGINQFTENNIPTEIQSDAKISRCSRTPVEDFFGKDAIDMVDVDVWGKLYRRDAIQGIPFPEDVFGADDFVFSARVFSAVRSVAYIDEKLYFYRMHAKNVTSLMPMRYILGTLRSREIVWREIVDQPAFDKQLRKSISKRFAYDIMSWAIKKTCRNNYPVKEMDELRSTVRHLKDTKVLMPQKIKDKIKVNLFCNGSVGALRLLTASKNMDRAIMLNRVKFKITMFCLRSFYLGKRIDFSEWCKDNDVKFDDDFYQTYLKSMNIALITKEKVKVGDLVVCITRERIPIKSTLVYKALKGEVPYSEYLKMLDSIGDYTHQGLSDAYIGKLRDKLQMDPSFLREFPILIDPKYRILDGQHRTCSFMHIYGEDATVEAICVYTLPEGGSSFQQLISAIITVMRRLGNIKR